MEPIFNEQQQEETQLLPLIKLCYHQFIRHWWWFAVSVAVCLAAGWWYQQCQPRVFKRQSVMLIEDADVQSGSMNMRGLKNSGISSLMQLNGVSVGDNLKNEIFIISSQRLMNRVVDRLHLDVDYTTTQALHTVALYDKQRPFEVLFQRPVGLKGYGFTVEKTGANTVHISNLHDRKGNDCPDIDAQLGEMVNTPNGPMCIVRSTSFNRWPEGAKVNVSRMTNEEATDAYIARLSASEYDKETSLIVLTLSDISVKRADDVLRTLFDVYREDVVDNKNRVALSTANFIDKRITLIGSELGNVESRLAEFKRRNQIVDYEQTAQSIAQQTVTARQASLQCETQLNVARYLAEYLSDHANDHDLIPVLNVGDASFNTQVSQYNELMNQRNRALGNSSEEQAVVREFDRQLAQMRQTVNASLHSYIGTLQLRLKDAQANEGMLAGKVSEAPEKEKQGLDIMRQQTLKEALYTYLLQKREEVALQQAINEANVRIVEGPVGGNMPVSPRTRIVMLVALLIGLAIPSGIIWLIISLDVAVRGREDVESATDIPILGDVPHLKQRDCASKLISSLSSDAPVVEAFRMLRYNLGFMRHRKQVIMSTSTTPSQGKSFTTTNMAIIHAMAGKRVLLIDADIRKRTISKDFHSPGLSSWLSDEFTKVDELIHSDYQGTGVDFIPAGPIPPNPAELLMSTRLEELIKELRERYDYIFIDTTPMCSVADASIINRVADMTLFIIRVGVQERSFLPQLDMIRRENRLRDISIVLNDSDVYQSRYGYSYGNYGYGYGYGRSNSKRKNRVKRVINRITRRG